MKPVWALQKNLVSETKPKQKKNQITDKANASSELFCNLMRKIIGPSRRLTVLKVFATNLNDLSPIPGTHGETESNSIQVVL